MSFTATDNSGNPLPGEDLAWLQVQARTNLVNWQTISDALSFTNGLLVMHDSEQSNFPARFYRRLEQ